MESWSCPAADLEGVFAQFLVSVAGGIIFMEEPGRPARVGSPGAVQEGPIWPRRFQAVPAV